MDIFNKFLSAVLVLHYLYFRVSYNKEMYSYEGTFLKISIKSINIFDHFLNEILY